jgi:hypothetical protein
MAFSFATRSRSELSGVHPALKDVMQRALLLSPVDFAIARGRRSSGNPTTPLPQMPGNPVVSRLASGHAASIVAFAQGQYRLDPVLTLDVADAVRRAAKQSDVALRWGGAPAIANWTDTEDAVAAQFAAGQEGAIPHYFELSPDAYPELVEPVTSIDDPWADPSLSAHVPLPGYQVRVAQWFIEQFGDVARPKLEPHGLALALLTAIACKETGYLVARMLNAGLSKSDILERCVGDTIDHRPNHPENKGRSAFPRNRAELEAHHPGGERMFGIARAALETITPFDSTYRDQFNHNPNKFCRGYGIFQYDLQHFKNDPDYFLQRRWARIDDCIDKAIVELTTARASLHRKHAQLGLGSGDALNLTQACCLAIAYNRGVGSFALRQALKQGHRNTTSGIYYGEEFHRLYLAVLSL